MRELLIALFAATEYETRWYSTGEDDRNEALSAMGEAINRAFIMLDNQDLYSEELAKARNSLEGKQV